MRHWLFSYAPRESRRAACPRSFLSVIGEEGRCRCLNEFGRKQRRGLFGVRLTIGMGLFNFSKAIRRQKLSRCKKFVYFYHFLSRPSCIFNITNLFFVTNLAVLLLKVTMLQTRFWNNFKRSNISRRICLQFWRAFIFFLIHLYDIIS